MLVVAAVKLWSLSPQQNFVPSLPSPSPKTSQSTGPAVPRIGAAAAVDAAVPSPGVDGPYPPVRSCPAARRVSPARVERSRPAVDVGRQPRPQCRQQRRSQCQNRTRQSLAVVAGTRRPLFHLFFSPAGRHWIKPRLSSLRDLRWVNILLVHANNGSKS